MRLCYPNIRYTSRTADRLFPTAFGAELVETRLPDVHPALAVREVIPGVVERLLDGDQQSHGCTDLFRAGLAVTDDAIKTADEIGVVGTPDADGRPAVIGHTGESNLHGLGYCATSGVAGA